MAVSEPPDGGCDDTPVEPGVWRYATAERVRVIIDTDEYFDVMQRAMLLARQRLLLIGWDFDTRIHLSNGRRWWQKAWKRNAPSRLGSFIPWLTRHRRRLEVRILKWGPAAIYFLARGWMMVDLLRWFPHKRIDFKFDTAHPIGCSHHQKIVVIDDKLAVCGCIDMTAQRWDTREHRETDRRRKLPGRGKLYGPWHDLTMLMEGPAAQALDELGRDRWRRAGGKPLAPPRPSETSCWPEGVEAHFENVEIGIARTRAPYKNDEGITEIEKLFLLQIARAKRFIYAENQYFASRAIAEAVSARLAEPDPPEIVIINPVGSSGPIESAAMDTARAQLVRAIQEIDHASRFHLYTPYSGEAAIYIHAKLTIVDDEILRIGSANFNNRSMRLDSECDAFIDCTRPANSGCTDAIRALRHSLLAEHCGVEEAEVGPLIERAGSMAAMIALVGGEGPRQLRPYCPPQLTEFEQSLADREMLDPEHPSEMLSITPAKRGLFRPGSLLARAMKRVKRKRLLK